MTTPVSPTRLGQIATDACESTFSSADSYSHSQTEPWNASIINKILTSLISESKTEADEVVPYKFAVNSTIIQHLSDPRPSGTDTSEAGAKVGRRGMHSAAGAYWNNEKDGMWSFKYEGGEKKGMDVVISVMWIAI